MSGSVQVVATIGVGGLIALASYVLGLARRRAQPGHLEAGHPAEGS